MKPVKVAVRIAIACALALTPVVLAAAPAHAIVLGPCNGTANINGNIYSPANDTRSNPVVIPKEGVAHWQGVTTTVITNHRGGLGLVIGPTNYLFAKWGSENKKKETKKAGTYNFDNFYARIPVDVVGIYKVIGTHQGKGGRCEGFVMVKLEGNPLATVPGAAAAGLTVLTGLGVAVAGMAKKP